MANKAIPKPEFIKQACLAWIRTEHPATPCRELYKGGPLFLDVTTPETDGIFILFKATGKHPSKAQQLFMDTAKDQGQATWVLYEKDEFIQRVTNLLKR